MSERSQAEETYEDAIEDGDSAVLLTQTEPGLFTMNLANLRPGETARIRVRYCQLLAWSAGQMRFALPTTIAPRYGRPAMEGRAVPEVSLDADNPFSIELVVEGSAAQLAVDCPTHEVTKVATEAGWVMRLASGSRLVHQSDRGSQYVSIRHSERLAEAGIQRSVGSKGDSYDNALAKRANGPSWAELINRCDPWMTRAAVELGTVEWVACFNNQSLLGATDISHPQGPRQTTTDDSPVRSPRRRRDLTQRASAIPGMAHETKGEGASSWPNMSNIKAI